MCEYWVYCIVWSSLVHYQANTVGTVDTLLIKDIAGEHLFQLNTNMYSWLYLASPAQ